MLLYIHDSSMVYSLTVLYYTTTQLASYIVSYSYSNVAKEQKFGILKFFKFNELMRFVKHYLHSYIAS